MTSDIRGTASFAAVETFYEALFAPGDRHVHSVEDFAPASEGAHALATGLTFVIVGLPGIVLALVLTLCVREPAGGYAEGLTAQAAAPKLAPALRRLP